MNTVLGVLGYVLLLLAGLAVVLSAVILVLIQANFILRQIEKLTRALRNDLDGSPRLMPSANQFHARSASKKGDG